MNVHQQILNEELKMADFIGNCLDDAEEMILQLQKIHDYRQRRIKAAPFPVSILLKVRYKLSDWAAIMTHELKKINKNG